MHPENRQQQPDRPARSAYGKVAIGSALGLGLSPIAPGTCGALLGVAMHGIVAELIHAAAQIPVLIVLLILVSVANHVLTPWAQQHWGSKDPGNFVLDEIAGYLVVPIVFPGEPWWQVAIWGFLLFRVFDIVKLPGARQIDRNMPGAWGILLDDIVSGLYAAGCLYLVAWLKPGWLVSLP